MSAKDTRTRSEKIRDLAANAGATEAERLAALRLIQSSTVSNKKSEPLTVTQVTLSSNDQWIKQQIALQEQQRKTARAVQRRINEEMRQKMYHRVEFVPDSGGNGPDYSGIVFGLVLLFMLLVFSC